MAIDESYAVGDQLVSYLHNDKLDIAKRKKHATHRILIHEHPFFILEEEGFYLMKKEALPKR